MKFIIIANLSAAISLADFDSAGEEEVKIVALDGVANHLLKINIIPYAIIGDFDSITQDTIEYFKVYKVILCKIDDQNTTDLDKGIKFCKKNGATEIIIINAFGGDRIDHILMNYRSLRKHYCKECKIRIKEKESYLEFFANCNLIISAEPDSGIKAVPQLSAELEPSKWSDIALLAAPHAKITSKGLKYEMKEHILEFGISESTSNSMLERQATIEIKGEAFLVYNSNCKIISNQAIRPLSI